MKEQPTYTQKRGIIYANTAGGKPVKFAVAWDTPNALRIINRLNKLDKIVNSIVMVTDRDWKEVAKEMRKLEKVREQSKIFAVMETTNDKEN